MKSALNRQAVEPLHTQIQIDLRRKIETAELKAGAVFPSERELSNVYGVSRMTVRQALSALRQEGLIYQERGVGTFVSKRKFDVHTRNLGGFSEEMQRRGLVPSSRVLLVKKEKAANPVAENLLIESDETVYRLERLRLVDDVPMAHETAFLPAAMFPDFEKHDFERESLYKILETNYAAEINRAEEVLEADCASPRMAQMLGIEQGAALLVVNRVVFSPSNRAIEAAQTVYRADRYRATFILTKNTV